MRSTDLTAQQRFDLVMAIAKRREWFGKLRKRMDAKGWDRTDAAYLAVVYAEEAALAAIAAVHDSRPREGPTEPARFFGDKKPRKDSGRG